MSLSSGVVRRHPLAECESCGLNNSNSIFVPSLLPSSGKVHIAIVGEAPGVTEARTGKPFAGPSGKLLDTVLRGHGLRREDAFITNACLCRPRDNATPSARDVAACAPRLHSELTNATSSGATIITLGNVAASAVFGTKVGITSFRVGPAKVSPLYPGVRVIPTVHPAYVLRLADAFPQFSDDIGKVNSNISIRWEAPIYKVFDEPYEAVKALHALRERNGDVVVDIEIGAEKDIAYVHPDQYNLLCVGFSYAPGRAIVIGEEALRGGRRDSLSPVLFAMGRVLENVRARVVAHNGKFDLAGLRFLAPSARLGFDTMLASYVTDERPGTHGLKYLAQEKLGAPNYAVEIHKYMDTKHKNFASIPRDILYRYNAYDVVCTYALKEIYEEQMQQQGVTKLHDVLCRASNMLMSAEMKGLTVDVPYVDKLADEFEIQLMDLEDMLGVWVNNPRSPIQVKEALLQLGITTPSTDVAHLIEIQRMLASKRMSSELFDSPEELQHKRDAKQFIEILMEHRKGAKLYGTYVKGILKRLYHGRVHPTFMLHGTTTGRLACRNPNLQNQPRDPRMRRMYIPSPGKKFVQVDIKGAELRVLCCEAKDEYLRQLFADGRDIHNEVAFRFFGSGFTKDQRVRAKAVVFGLAYGREAYSLAQEFQISEQQAQKYLDTFFSMIPQVVAWREGIKNAILHGEDDLISPPYGRHRRIWLVTEENKKDVVKEGLAFIPQAVASDICLTAACVLHEKYNLDVRLLVHDSILVETDAPEEAAEIMRKVVPQVAAEVYSDFVPFDVDVKIGDSWDQV